MELTANAAKESTPTRSVGNELMITDEGSEREVKARGESEDDC